MPFTCMQLESPNSTKVDSVPDSVASIEVGTHAAIAAASILLPYRLQT